MGFLPACMQSVVSRKWTSFLSPLAFPPLSLPQLHRDNPGDFLLVSHLLFFQQITSRIFRAGQRVILERPGIFTAVLCWVSSKWEESQGTGSISPASWR